MKNNQLDYAKEIGERETETDAKKFYWDSIKEKIKNTHNAYDFSHISKIDNILFHIGNTVKNKENPSDIFKIDSIDKFGMIWGENQINAYVKDNKKDFKTQLILN